MRQAIVNALLEDAGAAAIVGARVYGAQGALGGISRDLTPEAFSADLDLLPSIVVRMETRSARPDRLGRGVIAASQIIALWCYEQSGYDLIASVIRAAKQLLHFNASLRPVADPVNWTETRWTDDTPEQVDGALGVPVRVSRYQAVIVERLT